MFRTPVRLYAAGRTDTGVHATGQVAHVDVPVDALPNAYPRSPRSGDPGIPAAAAAPRPVLAHRRPGPRYRPRAQRVSTPGSRRCDVITNTDCRPRPTGWSRNGPATSPPGRVPLDVDAMTAASRELLGLHDFAAFCRHREGATTIRELQRLDWSRDGDLITAHVTADAFCWSMVRSLVGALLAVGEHRRSPAWCREIAHCDRPVQRFRGRTCAGVDVGRGGLPARRRAGGADR